MDFRKRDKMVEGCNWLMVGVAAGWVAYTFAGSFSSPADSAVSLLPPTVVQQALHLLSWPLFPFGEVETIPLNRPTQPRIALPGPLGPLLRHLVPIGPFERHRRLHSATPPQSGGMLPTV